MVALSQFESGVTEVRVLLDLQSVAEADGVGDSGKNNALYRAAVILLVSHFESFLKTLAEDFVDVAGAGNLESRQIPRGLRELHTMPQMSAILECNNDTQRGVLLKKLNPFMALWNDQAKPARGTLQAATLSRQVTNADSETIDRLFDYMGSGTRVCNGDIDVSRAGGDIVSLDIRMGLTDVTKCRNDIAHGDVSRKPTDKDVIRYIDFLSALSQRLQRRADALISDLVI